MAAIRAALPAATLHVLGVENDVSRPGVRFFGRVGDETKRSELAAASVFCAPNLGGESFGIVVAEAMASGCAVVASSIPAFEHVAGSTARFAPPGNPHKLAVQVIELLIDPQKAERLGAEAAARVERFDGRMVAAAYIAAYEEAIAAG